MDRPAWIRGLTRKVKVEAEPLLADPACAAPAIQMFFRPNGDVRVCCRNETMLGNVNQASLAEIWASSERQKIMSALATHDYSAGCEQCGAEVTVEGRDTSYPEQFDSHMPVARTGPPNGTGPAWPRHMDFTLSINCNLQCEQCNGDSSSAIRTQREHRAPLPRGFGDEFFSDLKAFLPHLHSASFSGGEPFLAEENFRVWEMLAECNPDLPVTIVTNATQMTPRVRAVLEKLRVSFRFSIDGASAEVYEGIRVGAEFDSVIRNVEELVTYTRRKGTEAAVNHCLVIPNASEFPELLLWADSLELPVHVSVVRDDTRVTNDAPEFSIVRQDPKVIREIYEGLRERDAEMQSTLALNLPTWNVELDRLRSWSEMDATDLRSLWGISGVTVLMFKCQGSGPSDDNLPRADLAEFAEDGIVHTVVWDRYETVIRASPSLDDTVGPGTAARLIGSAGLELRHIIADGLGPLESYETVSETPERVDAHAVFGDHDVRVVMVPMRDENGWAETAHLLLAVRRRST